MDLAALALLMVPCKPSDLQRFPDGRYLVHVQYVTDQRLAYLEARQGFYPPWSDRWVYWHERAGEVRKVHYAWAILHDATCAVDLDDRRRHLENLRRRIGEANYAAGQMPMP